MLQYTKLYKAIQNEEFETDESMEDIDINDLQSGTDSETEDQGPNLNNGRKDLAFKYK